MPGSNRDHHSPQDVILEGKASPRQTRFLYGGYVVLAMAAVVLSWNRAPSALLGVSAIILSMATITSLLTYALSKAKHIVAITCLWVVLGANIIVGGLFISSLFLGVPERGALFVARLLNQDQLAIFHSRGSLVVIGPSQAAFPDSVRVLPSAEGDRFDRVATLSKLPPVAVNGSTIQVDAPALYFSVLRLQDGVIQTNGRDVTIEALRIEAAGNAAIRSAIPAASEGQPGRSGGRVTLIIYDRIIGQLAVDLQGGTGGKGANGRPGPNGANGGPGENSSQSAVGCNHGGGTGGPGLPGGPGEEGQPGQPGGHGGTLVLQSPTPDKYSALIAFSGAGGSGGPGGLGGPGGAGGIGGPGGHGGGYCGGGKAGPGGANGPDGRVGPTGPAGQEGSFLKLPLDPM